MQKSSIFFLTLFIPMPRQVGRIQSESGVILDLQRQKSHLPNLGPNLNNI